jgi:SAM-dependent methyltransferase
MVNAGQTGHGALQAGVVASYSTPEVVETYRERMYAPLRQWERTLLDLVHGPAGTVVVMGCGSGREAFGLEDRDWQVIAVDVTAALLEVARAEGRARGSTIRFELTDGVHLPASDASTDAVTLWSQVLGNVPTRAGRAALMADVHRILKPGRVASFSVHDRARTFLQLQPGEIVSVNDPESGDVFVVERDGGVERLNHYFDEDEIHSLANGAGFDDIHLWHTSDLGEAWDNVYVAAVTKPR